MYINVDLFLTVQSERNAAFYRQDEFTNVYPKLQVYPVEGGEIQLEQLKARLPRYCPPPSPMLKNVSVLPQLLLALCTMYMLMCLCLPGTECTLYIPVHVSLCASRGVKLVVWY